MPRYLPINIDERYEKHTTTFNISPDLFRHSKTLENRTRKNFNKLFPKPPTHEELLDTNFITNNKFVGPIKLTEHIDMKPGDIKKGIFTIRNKSNNVDKSLTNINDPVRPNSQRRRKFTVSDSVRPKSQRRRKFTVSDPVRPKSQRRRKFTVSDPVRPKSQRRRRFTVSDPVRPKPQRRRKFTVSDHVRPKSQRRRKFTVTDNKAK